MLIQPNEQGWTMSDQGPWQLIFNDDYIIRLFAVGIGTSTQEKLFTGTKNECELKIAELGLPHASNNIFGGTIENTSISPPDPEIY